MKSLTAVLVLSLFATTAVQSQTEFVIGAEWLNDPARVEQWWFGPHVPSPADWDSIAELGLKWGVISLHRSWLYSYANDALSNAESRGIKLILNRYHDLHDAALGQRWQYHPEYTGHYPYPFEGRVGSFSSNAGATWFPDDQDHQSNAWFADAESDSAGFMAVGLRAEEEQPLNATYRVRVRMKLASGTTLDSTEVCRLHVVRDRDGATKSDTIYAIEFGATETYREIGELFFRNSPTGPLAVTALTATGAPTAPEIVGGQYKSPGVT